MALKDSKKEVDAYLNELVPFTAMFDGEKYKDDITVWVNEKMWQIERGRQVMIPRKVYFVLMDAQRQAVASSRHNTKLQDRFNNEVLPNFQG